MVSSCVVIGCTQRFSKDSKVLFHRFPIKNPSLCRKWLRAIQRKDLNDGNLKYIRICSLHFNQESYLVGPSNKLKLKSDAIPNIGLNSKPQQRTLRTNKSTKITQDGESKVPDNESEPKETTMKSAQESQEEEEEVDDVSEDESSSETIDSDDDEEEEEEHGVHFQVKEFRSVVPAQFTTSSGAGGPCYILVWNPENLPIKGLPPTVTPPVEESVMPSDMQGMENRIRELESQISHLADSNTRLNQQVELLTESNKDLKKKLKTLQQNKRRLLKRLNTMEGMVNDWKDDRKPFTFCSDDL